ncbi:MAG: hypothetical protein AB1631_29705, partial [Acidobacteriota bacterium]
WYSATSEEQARQMHIAQMGYENEEAGFANPTIASITVLPDDKLLTITKDDFDTEANDYLQITKTAREWAAETEGFLASTCW